MYGPLRVNIQHNNDPLITKYFASNMLEVRSHQAKDCDSGHHLDKILHRSITNTPTMVEYKMFPTLHIERLKKMDIQKVFLDVLFNNPVNCWDYIVSITDV